MSLQRQIESYQLVTPKTISESVTLTKKVLMIFVSEMMIERKVFKQLNYVEKMIYGVPVKIIQCDNEPEMRLAFTLRLALEELKSGNLKEIKIIMESKEEPIEEYSLRFKYTNGDVELEMSQGDQNFPKVSSLGVKKAITNVLANVKNFANSGFVHPLPHIDVLRIQVSYNKETPEYTEIFSRKPSPTDTLKNICGKVKLGRVKKAFGEPLFAARSTLINEHMPTSEDMELDEL